MFVSTLYKLPTQEEEDSSTIISTRRVRAIKFAQIKAFYEYHLLVVYLTIDAGAEFNMIRTAFAESISTPIRQTTQHALQADGMTPPPPDSVKKVISPYCINKKINYSILIPWFLRFGYGHFDRSVLHEAQ